MDSFTPQWELHDIPILEIRQWGLRGSGICHVQEVAEVFVFLGFFLILKKKLGSSHRGAVINESD